MYIRSVMYKLRGGVHVRYVQSPWVLTLATRGVINLSTNALDNADLHLSTTSTDCCDSCSICDVNLTCFPIQASI